MTFKALQYDSGKVKQLKLAGAASGVVKGDPLAFTAGEARLAINSDDECEFVAIADASSTVANPAGTILAVVTQGVEFEAKTKENTAQSQVGVVYALHSDGTVANDAAGDVFLVTKIVGPAANKTVRGYFLSRKEA